MKEKAFESRLNVLLSELLNQIGVFSHSEQIGKGRKDIIAYHNGLQIVIEGSYNKEDAEKDAKRRIEQLPVDMAIAIYYYETFPQNLSEIEIKERLKNSKFYVKIIVPEDISNTLYEYFYKNKIVAKPVEDWILVDLNSLANLIREAAQFIISEEDVKNIESEVNNFINQFVNYLSTHQQSLTIAKNLYEILFKWYGFSIGDPDKIKEIIFAQSGLALLLSCIYYETIRYIHSKESLRNLSKIKNDPKLAIEEAVNEILKENYEPIFLVTKDLVLALPSSEKIFKLLIDLSSKIASKKSLLRRDLAGRIYHKIVGDWSLRKNLATYYTQIPSAYLLLYLAKPSLGRICDFACGSGTLLTAAYSAVKNSYCFSLLKNNIEEDPREINEKFHKEFIQSCYAFDVLKYATQITALNIAFHNPECPITEFNVYTLPLGAKRVNNRIIVSLGSLEFIRPVPQISQISLGQKSIRIGLSKEEEKTIKLQPFDLVVMNPPFTRAGGRLKKESGEVSGGLFGFMEEEMRRKLIEEYDKVRRSANEYLLRIANRFLTNSQFKFLLTEKEFEDYKNIGQAGEGLLFLYLAHQYTKENGKIAFVLPKNLLSAVSWFLARVLLAYCYHIEYIVVSYDKKNGYNFSESTKLSELLLVARKVSEHAENEKTKFVVLLSKPKSSIEAISLANQIEKTDRDDYVTSGNSAAYIVNVGRREILENIDNWGRIVFLPDPEILSIGKKLLSGYIEIEDFRTKIPLIRFNSLINSIGIDSRQFKDNFKLVPNKLPNTVEVLYGGDENVRRKMIISPNAFAIPSPSGQSIFEKKSGKLLLPSAIPPSAHVTAMLSDKPTLSYVFYVVRLKNESEERLKALCLWLNTTWGFLTILMNRQEISTSWPQMKIAQWRLLPVLNIDELDEKQIKNLAELFDKLKNVNPRRIYEQYEEGKTIDKFRLELDKGFLSALNIEIEDEILHSFYKKIKRSFKQLLGL